MVVALLEIIRFQQEQIQELRDEIARLKGQKPKPKIKPSTLEKDSGDKDKQAGSTNVPAPPSAGKPLPFMRR